MSSKTPSSGLFARFSFNQLKDCSPDSSSLKPPHMEENKELNVIQSLCFPSGWICQAAEQNKTLNRWWPGKLGCNCSLTNLGSRTCQDMTGVSMPAVYFDLRIPSLCLKAHGRRKLTWLIILGQNEEEEVSTFTGIPYVTFHFFSFRVF